MATETENRAERSAQGALELILIMVKRLEHAQDCDGDCSLADAEVHEGLGWLSDNPTTDEERSQYHDEDEARQSILESHYGASLRSDWYSPGSEPEAVEYQVTLGGGGPATRIRGMLGSFNQPDTAEIEYQDWGTPWTPLILDMEEEAAVVKYVEQLYLGD